MAVQTEKVASGVNVVVGPQEFAGMALKAMHDARKAA